MLDFFVDWEGKLNNQSDYWEEVGPNCDIEETNHAIDHEEALVLITS